MDEKRIQKRDILRIDARYNDVAGNVLKGKVLNISLGGAYIHTGCPLNFGASLILGLDAVDIGKVFDVHGHVVRVDPGIGMAVEFTHKGDEKIQRLIDMIKRVTFTSVRSPSEEDSDHDIGLKNTENLSNNTIDRGDRVSGRESRKHSRKLIKIEARYQDIKGSVLKGTVRNISLGGVYIETVYPLDLQASVVVSLDAQDIGKVIDVQGRVVRVIPHRGMAVEFLTKEHKDIRLLLQTLRRLDQASLLSLSRSAMGD